MFKALLIAVSLLAVSPALAQSVDEVNQRIDTVLGPHDIYQTAIETIQKALAEGNVDGIAGYIPFGEPITVNGAPEIIVDEADLVARFDELLNPKVVTAVTGQDYANLFVNQNGIMFGQGELWIGGICVDETCTDVFVNITAINNQ